MVFFPNKIVLLILRKSPHKRCRFRLCGDAEHYAAQQGILMDLNQTKW